MRKRFFSMLLAMSMVFTLIPANGIVVKAAEGLTRAEWISELVETFAMTVEDDSNMPDNYFSDISSDMSYYRDVLVAVEFGVIELDAGENFRPDDPATREFAAQTLNHCLNFQLDDENYTYSEYESVESPDDIQIAVNRGWFELSGDDFLPEQEITVDESSVMIADAKATIEAEAIDENYESTYEFDENVIVVPETASVVIDSDNTVTIENDDTVINEGDIFVVYKNGYPVALKALTVESSDGVTVITSTKDGTENTVTSADSEGVMDIDPDDFTFNELTTYSVIDTSDPNAQSEELSFEIQSIDYDEATKTLVASQKISIGSSAAGSVSVRLSNIKLGYKEKPYQDEYEAVLTADTNVSTAVSFDFADYAGLPSSITLGYINIGGIGSITLDIELSMSGGLSMSWDGVLKAGFNYSYGNFRLIKDYTKKGFTFTAEAQIEVGLKLAANISLILIDGSVFATIGARMNYTAHDYDSGMPRSCVTIKGYLYAYVGTNVNIVGKSVFSERQDIFTEKNSPVRVVYHYEDNVLMTSCTRGQNISYTTSVSSNYFNPSPSYGQGSYGGTGTGDGSGGTSEPVVIWEYDVDDEGNATITKYNGSASAVAIPSKIDGYTVTEIGSSAFYGNTAIKAVTIPDSVVEIGNSAFYNCTNLNSVVLSKNLKTLGKSAFSSCIALTEIEIPKTLEKASYSYDSWNNIYYNGVFAGSGLKKATLENGTITVAAYLFLDAYNLETVILPDTVTGIGICSFRDCSSLKNIIIPESVTIVSWGAFLNCDSLSQIEIPDAVVAIGDIAFQGCKNLNHVTLSKNLETLGYAAFGSCSSLVDIYIPKTLKTARCEISSYDNDYYYGPFSNSGLKTATIEVGTTAVVENLFLDAYNLECITIPDTVIEIGEHSFEDCTSLKEISIPEFVTKIQSDAFRNCESIEQIIIPDSVIIIQDGAFAGCKKASKVVLSKSLELLGANAFLNCTLLTELEIPKSLSKAGGGSFYNSGLKTVTFEKGSTMVAQGLFMDANNLENVTLLDTMTSIGEYAFENCKSLKEITIPSSVKEIGNYAFSNCAELNNVSLPDLIVTISSYMFSGCQSLTKINIPYLTKKIESSAFSECTSLEEIVLPDSLEEIGRYAFSGCTSLETVDIPKSVTMIDDAAFRECKGLIEATVNIQGKMGDKVFYDCDSLTKLTLSDGVTEIGSYICYGCDSLYEVKFSKYIEKIPDSAFRLCQSLTSVVLPRFCKEVDENAFAEDTQLKSVYVPSRVESIQNNSFSYPTKMIMYGKSGSYAEEYASSRNMEFIEVSAPIKSIEYVEKSIEIACGDKIRPQVNIEPAFDTSDLTFVSDNEAICTVSETGEIYGNNYGTATITAISDSGAKTKIEVTVIKTADAIVLDKTEAELELGNFIILTATLDPIDSTDTIAWSSSDEDVVLVEDGKVSAIGVGTAIVTAKTTGGKTAFCTVKVIGTVTITASAGNNGQITPSGKLDIKTNETRKYVIIPNYGYIVRDVLVNGKSVGAVESYTFSNITADAEITAEFAKIDVVAGDGFVIISSDSAISGLNLIVAEYNADGSLLSCIIKEVNTKQNESKQFTVPTGENVKVMLWSGFDNMRPVW